MFDIYSSSSGAMVMSTGGVVAGTTGGIYLGTGSATTGNSGPVTLTSGLSGNGNSGSIFVSSGQGSLRGGAVYVTAGCGNSGAGGEIVISAGQSGNFADAASGGRVTVRSGYGYVYSSGSLVLATVRDLFCCFMYMLLIPYMKSYVFYFNFDLQANSGFTGASGLMILSTGTSSRGNR